MSDTFDPSALGFETRQIHAGAAPDPATGARATPIYQTTSYAFRDSQHAADLFALAEPGNIYTRIMNPTQGVLEERITSLEGGVTSLAVASGQAANRWRSSTWPSRGATSSPRPRSTAGRTTCSTTTCPSWASRWTSSRIPTTSTSGAKLVRPNTKAFYGEVIGNPKGDVLDIAGVSGVAHEAGVPLIVDNTSPRRTSAARSSTAPTSSCTRSPSSSAATAPRSAASSSTVAASTGPPAAVPDVHRAGPELPRPHVCRRARPRRIRRQGPHPAPARLRRGDQPVQRLPDPAGRRDAVGAHGPPLPEHRRHRRLPRGPRRRRGRPLSRPGLLSVERGGEEVPAEGHGLPSSTSS